MKGIKTQTLNLDNIEIDNITQRTVSIIGGKGSGKTQTLKMMAYVSPDKLPCYIFDPLDIIHIEGFQRVVITRAMAKKADVDKKDKDVGDDLGKKYGMLFNSVKEKKIIFSFRDMLQEEIVFFCNAFFQNWKPKDCLIFFDEIHEFCPERGMGMEFSEEIERMIRHCRNKNVGIIMNTQSPSFTSKKVLKLTDFLILYRVTYPNDVDVVKEIVQNMLSKEQTNELISKVQTKPFLEGFTLNFIP